MERLKNGGILSAAPLNLKKSRNMCEMFALAAGHHPRIAREGTYCVDAHIKGNDRLFDQTACKLASPLINRCFPGVTKGLTRAHIRAENFRALVTVTGEQEGVCGQLLVGVQGDGRYLLRGLCVAPQHRRKGVGTLLLRTLLAKVVLVERPTEIRIDTFDPHSDALAAWYARFGFAPAGDAVGDERCLVLASR